MLKQLEYHLKFSSTGREFKQKILFQPGLTVITGGNEQGKSLILEMIEYAWFGSAALRGQSSDYEVLDVDMTWQTRGDTYTVSRHGAVQNLNKTKAVGAKAVNLEILKILGINLAVFRIACSAKQGELDRLTARMLPTERRKMVDEVVGLNSLEVVEKLCRAEANATKRLRDDLAKRLVTPIQPEAPEDYLPSSQLESVYKNNVRVEAERNQLERIPKPTLPMEPIKGEFSDDVAIYEKTRKEKDIERAGVERTLRSIPPASFTRQDILEAEAYYEQLVRGPVPVYTRQQLDEWQEQFNLCQKFSDTVECPNCHTTFIPDGDAMEEPERPPMNLIQLSDERRKIDKWEGHEYKELPEPKLKYEQIKIEARALDQAEVREKLQAELDTIEIMPSRADELSRMETWNSQLVIYNRNLERYMDDLTRWSDAQDELAKLPPVSDDVETKLRESQIYEEQMRTYNANRLAFEELTEEVDSLNLKAEGYNDGAEALKFVRSQVKQHLVPSLNRVASHLLKEMTNGKRNTITVDEDFEVTVDGQPVRTLSGSGVSVVNLALRIALGQVLTQKILPIFLADEIDHDMDADRAEATHAAIKSLTQTLSQILVVSHKQIEGDNYIGV